MLPLPIVEDRGGGRIGGGWRDRARKRAGRRDKAGWEKADERKREGGNRGG